jgi:hypothetical protein
MQTVYVLQVQGLGDREEEFVNVGVYSSKANAEDAQRRFISEALEDFDLQIVTQIEEFTLNA